MVEYGERLEAAMKARSVTTQQLADKLGISYQAVKKVLDGKSAAFTAPNNVYAARFLKISSDWLATGEGVMEANKQGEMLWPFGDVAEYEALSEERNGAFTSFHIADANQEYLVACEARLRNAHAPVAAYHGYAHATVDMILPQLQRNGLHFALLDPFNAGHLHFSIIEKLATLPRIDIAVHLSTGDIQRNIASEVNGATSPLDNFAPGWRDAVRSSSSKHEMREQFIDHWKNLVAGTGLNVCGTMYPVRNSKRSIMYWLCLLSRNQLADRLWRDACNLSTRSLF